MAIKENNKNKENYTETVMESAFSRTKISLNAQPCAFITAYVGEPTAHNENEQGNKTLENEIKESGLSFIKLAGTFTQGAKAAAESEVKAEAFCVIDTGLYSPEDFTKLAVYWCGEFNQQGVLITEPDLEGAKPNKLIKAMGKLYGRNGNVLNEFKNATMDDVENYFKAIFGKSFAFTEMLDIDIKETKYDIYNWISGMGAAAEFKRKYPNLA